MSVPLPVRPTGKQTITQCAVWLVCWSFLIPASVLALVQIPVFGELTNSWPSVFFIFTLPALPVLALVGLVAGFWTWRSRVGVMRLLILAVTVFLYWHIYGNSVTKLLFGGFA